MNEQTVNSTSYTTQDIKVISQNTKVSGNHGSVLASSGSKNTENIKGHLKQMQKSESRIQSQMRILEAQSTQ